MFFRRRLLDCGFYFDPRWKAVGDAAWVVALLQAKVRMQTLWEPLAIFTFTGENLGATPVSAAEGESLREGARFTTVRTAAAVLAHRIRKGLAGAYRRRRVEIEAYTLDSPDKRQRRTSDGVGSNWPST